MCQYLLIMSSSTKSFIHFIEAWVMYWPVLNLSLSMILGFVKIKKLKNNAYIMHSGLSGITHNVK